MILSSICIYPVKSTAGLEVQEAHVEPRGFRNDRRWMIVDVHGRFVTGRQLSRMVLMRAMPDGDGLLLQAPSMPDLRIPAPDEDAQRLVVKVWDDLVDVACADADANAWIGEFLGCKLSLVKMDARSTRVIDPEKSSHPDEVSFADGYPFLVISQASLDGLSAKLAEPVAMGRFRPNLVIAGCDAHAEDGWRRIRIGQVAFDVAKTCTRCVFTTVDPIRGERDPTGEPLRTLKTYRRSGEGITFGMNLIARGTGRLRVGDQVAID